MRRLLALAGFLAAAGCTVGPDFERPPPPAVPAYTADPLPAETAAADALDGQAQRFLQEMDIPGQWWTLFQSPALSQLIEQALGNNHDLKAAQAALRAAQENVQAARGGFYPTVQAGFNVSRQKTSNAIAPVPNNNANVFSLYNAQVGVSYMPDVFGLTARTVEAAQAQAEAQRFQVEATYLTLTSNVVTAVLQEASLRRQIAATNDIIAALNESLRILRRQFDLGQVAGIDVAAQETALATAQQQLPPLQKQLAQARDLLKALTGRYAGEVLMQEFELADLKLPSDLPLSLPSTLVEHRPDVRQAEANLHAASAQIGVAVANRLPNIMLTPALGASALGFGGLFAAGNDFWTLAAGITAPIFDGGTLKARERQARALFDQAAEQYKGTVIGAFQNVADSLYALQADAEGLRAAVNAERAAKVSLDLVRRQLQLGQVNYLALLTAQQAYQQAVISLVQAQANRLSDTVALFQALGGGWWNREPAAAQDGAAKPSG